VHDHQRDDQHDRSDRNAEEIEHEPQRFQQRTWRTAVAKISGASTTRNDITRSPTAAIKT